MWGCDSILITHDICALHNNEVCEGIFHPHYSGRLCYTQPWSIEGVIPLIYSLNSPRITCGSLCLLVTRMFSIVKLRAKRPYLFQKREKLKVCGGVSTLICRDICALHSPEACGYNCHGLNSPWSVALRWQVAISVSQSHECFFFKKRQKTESNPEKEGKKSPQNPLFHSQKRSTRKQTVVISYGV